jgi:hypothetical protein
MQTLYSHSLRGTPSAGPGRVSQKQLHHPKHAMHLLGGSGGQQRQRLLGLTRVEPSSTSSTSTNAHRSAVSLHQRQGGSPDHSHHGQHVIHHHRQLRDDGSLKVRLATVGAAVAAAGSAYSQRPTLLGARGSGWWHKHLIQHSRGAGRCLPAAVAPPWLTCL